MENVNVKYCSYCDVGAWSMKRCAGCLVAIYCNTDCQRQHWSEHKPFCMQYKDQEATLNCLRQNKKVVSRLTRIIQSGRLEPLASGKLGKIMSKGYYAMFDYIGAENPSEQFLEATMSHLIDPKLSLSSA